MQGVGSLIRELRIKEGYPLRKVAAFLEMDQAVLSKIERGLRRPSKAHVLKLAGNRAYAGIGRQLRVVDVSDPAQLVETGVYNAPDDVLDIHVHGQAISLAVDEAGMINLYATDIFLPQFFHESA